jgi:hypothetical protein
MMITTTTKVWKKKCMIKNLVTHGNDVKTAWYHMHNMMTTRWTQCTQSHYDIKKKNKIVSDELIDTLHQNINVCKKSFDTVRATQYTHRYAAQHTWYHATATRVATTWRHHNTGQLTTLHDKCQHANNGHLTTACYKKFYDEVIYTQWQK